MKTCPNCGEMNGEANDKCYKCGADLSERYCTYCDKVYSSKTHTCQLVEVQRLFMTLLQ